MMYPIKMVWTVQSSQSSNKISKIVYTRFEVKTSVIQAGSGLKYSYLV